MHPPVFSDLSFDAAMAKSQDDKKLLLVDATASWCQPCKHMDKTTWVDGGVVNAIGARAIAIQFDVDEQKELAKQLSVRAMPTVIAFRDGKEIDRVVGVRAPRDFVAWLEGLERGETSLDIARAAVRDKPDDVKARLSFAQMLVERNELDEATAEYEKLWTSMDGAPAIAMMKYGFVGAQISQLVGRHPGAREAFTRVRNATDIGTRDWVTLNQILGETDRTLSWYEGVRDQVQPETELAALVDGAVIPLLVEKERWADAGRAFSSPVKLVEVIIARKKLAAERTASLPADQAKQVVEMIDKMNAQEISVLRRALDAAGRDEELRAVDELAKNADPSWITPSAK